MYNLIKDTYSFIDFFLYYNHTCIPLSKAYIVYMYKNMCIFMYCNPICIPKFKEFISVLLSCHKALVVSNKDFCFFSLCSLNSVFSFIEADLWLNPQAFIPRRRLA